MKLVHIVAADDNLLIGQNNSLPWFVKEDLSYFYKTTKNQVLIMGRKTYESINVPLKNRTIIVLSTNPNYKSIKEKIIVKSSILDAIDFCKENYDDKEVFISGGRDVFLQTLPLISKIYFTQIKGSFKGNIYYPKIDLKSFKLIKTTNGTKCNFLIYQKD